MEVDDKCCGNCRWYEIMYSCYLKPFSVVCVNDEACKYYEQAEQESNIDG